jgi:predicted aspartyl protease
MSRIISKASLEGCADIYEARQLVAIQFDQPDHRSIVLADAASGTVLANNVPYASMPARIKCDIVNFAAAAARARAAEQQQEQIQSVLEQHPELFFKHSMLYVRVAINGVPDFLALVDTGAQSSVIGIKAAARAEVSRDDRVTGTVLGVGEQKVQGVAHIAHIKLGSCVFPAAFVVADLNPVLAARSYELILGIDFLRRNRAVIDMGREALVIDSETVPFLNTEEIRGLRRLHGDEQGARDEQTPGFR